MKLGELSQSLPTVHLPHFLVGIYMSKVNNRNTRTRSEICSKLSRKTLKRRHWPTGLLSKNRIFL